MTPGGQVVTKRQLCWPTGTGGPVVDGQPPDRRAQPVGPDDQVVAVLAAVVEGHLDRPVDPLEGADPGAEAHRHPLAQDGVQVGPVQGQARADPPPEAGKVHVDQHPPAPVEDPLAADLDPPVGDGLLQAEGPQGPGPVGGQVDAGPGTSQAAARSITSGSHPAWRSARARARPARPAPTTRTRSCFMCTNCGS